MLIASRWPWLLIGRSWSRVDGLASLSAWRRRIIRRTGGGPSPAPPPLGPCSAAAGVALLLLLAAAAAIAGRGRQGAGRAGRARPGPGAAAGGGGALAARFARTGPVRPLQRAAAGRTLLLAHVDALVVPAFSIF